tara:strand:- start:110 stop:286 length:177 start_codon:yes stop_codon:yes gene_type:complete
MQAPEGYSFSKTRGGLIAIHNPEGEILHYSLDCEEAIRALSCYEGKGVAREVDDYVEL